MMVKKNSKRVSKVTSREGSIKLVVIDIGSNAIRCVLYYWSHEFGLSLEIKKRFPIRLGESVFKTKTIAPLTLKKCELAFKQMQKFIQMHKPHNTIAVATSAVRDAHNKEDFLKLSKKYNLPVNIITGQQEAKIIFQGILAHFKSIHDRIISLDLGGGSLEVTIFKERKIVYSKSLQVGAVRTLLKLKDLELSDHNSHFCLTEILQPALREINNKFNLENFVVVATGGNAEALLKVTSSSNNKITLSDLIKVQTSLGHMNFTTRSNKFQIRKDRADIVLISTIIFIKILRALNKNEILVPGLGLRQSLAMMLIKPDSAHLSPVS